MNTMFKKPRLKNKNIFVGDFETTVYDGQERTDVWASALTLLFDETDHVDVFNSLPATYDYIVNNIKSNCIIYYHNLKFDGTFWLSYLMERGDYMDCFEEAAPMQIYEGTPYQKELKQGEFLHDKDMPCGTYKYLISDMGAWYNVKIKRHDGYIIELRDSLKLIPCSVKKMGTDFKTKHQKTSIEYTGFRVPGGYITDEEKEYIANDVLVVKEVLEIMYSEGHNKLTIGSCCWSEYKSMIGDKPKGRSVFDEMFPRLEHGKLNKEKYGSENCDAYIRMAYHGGWCYVKEDRQGVKQKYGCTADVNSLYPSVMLKASGNRYPTDNPHFFDDMETWNKIKDNEKLYYFVRVKTRFELKPGFLPFIQIKRNKNYIGTEMLKTSDVLDHKTGKYYKWLIDKDGERVPAAPIMTFSKTDWELVQKHYNLSDTVILDGCWFYTSVGLFDQYILKYKKIKQNSKGAKRSIAKLFSNNLYGRFAQGTNSSFKHISMGTDKALTSETIFEQNKNAGFIAIGAAITSYARKFTIDAAQANYDVFCYADTDSIHCCCKPEEVKGIQIHESEYLHWKIETEWDEALFVRQKTYAEHIVVEDGEKVKEPYWNIKCAGLPDRCKKLFTISLKGVDNVPKDDIIQLKPNEKEMAFIKVKRNIDCFKQDLVIPGKLLPLQIPGGTVLAEVDFTLH